MTIASLVSKDYATLSSEDTASKAMGLLSKGAEAILISDDIKAVVTHKSILRTRGSPDNEKLKSLFTHTPILSSDSRFEDAVKTMLVNGIDAVPVETKGKVIGILTERSLLKNIGSDFKDTTAKDVMTPVPICITESEDIATAKNLMIENNISRLPVLDKNGKLTGVVEDIDLLKIFIYPEQKQGRGDKTGNKNSKNNAPVRDVMRDVVYTAWPQESITKIAQKLPESRTCIIVDEAGKPVGIVTPKDILEVVPVPEEGVYVQITGLHEEDEFTTNEVHREIDTVVKKLSAIVNIQFVWIHEKHVHEAGGKPKYSVRVRASTDWGLFVSKYWGYDLIDSVSQAMKEMEREVLKHKEKLITKKKGRGPLHHGRKD